VEHGDEIGAVEAGVWVWQRSRVALGGCEVGEPAAARAFHELVEHALLKVEYV
jgi:hypothetical protein